MTPSPFHGIFSTSLGEELAANARKKAKTPPMPELSPAAGASAATQGQVSVDIFEVENYYIVKAPIAGVKLSDLDIEIADTVLTIRGQRKQIDTVADDQYYLRECFWGEFSRSVTFPFSIDPKKVKATFNKDCILKILIPKEEKVKIVRIND